MNPCFQYIDDISEICSSYFKDLNLNFFGHVSVQPNGEYTFLCSNHEWPREFFAKRKIPPAGFTIYHQIKDKVIFPSMDTGDALGWSDSAIINAKEQFAILNPMVIFQKYSDHYEGFLFDIHDDEVYEKYLNQFDLFENFIHYYKDKSSKLLEIVNRSKLLVDQQYIPEKMPTLNEHVSCSKFERLNCPNKKYYIKRKNIDIAITQKEYECLTLLAHGYRVKRISQKLCISTRTVESHVNNIKQKLQVRTREEMIDTYWNSKSFFNLPG